MSENTTENDVQIMTTTSERTTQQESDELVDADGNKKPIGGVGPPVEEKAEDDVETKDDVHLKSVVETGDEVNNDLKGADGIVDDNNVKDAEGVVNNDLRDDAETKGEAGDHDSVDVQIKDEIDNNLQDTTEERTEQPKKKDELGNNEDVEDDAGTNDLSELAGGSSSFENITASSNDAEDGQEDIDTTNPIASAAGTRQRVPLFEQPIERDGPRSRRQAEPFQSDIGTPKRKQFTPEKVAKGQGIKLKNIGWISDHIKSFNFKQKHLKNLHHILFGRAGDEKYRISNILEFSGYPFFNDRSKMTRSEMDLESFTISDLKNMFEIINFNVTAGHKMDLCARILEFLRNPTDDEVYKHPDTEKKAGRRLSARNGKPSKRKHSETFVPETEPRVTRSRLTRSFPSNEGASSHDNTSTSTVETEEVPVNSGIAVCAEIPVDENDQSAAATTTAAENAEGETNVEAENAEGETNVEAENAEGETNVEGSSSEPSS